MRLAILPPAHGWSGGQFSLVRAALGTYLALHFLWLLPWGKELFSNQGVLPKATLSPLISSLPWFPNLLALIDSPLAVTLLLLVATALSLAFAFGHHTRACALVLWLIWASLLGRNPLILNPGIPYVGWMLLLCAALPGKPFLSLGARGRQDPAGSWHLPSSLYHVAWAVMAWGYTYSGLMKLGSLSWLDGQAIWHVLQSPLARDHALRDLLVQAPGLLTVLSFGTLGLELLAGPLSLWRRARAPLWFALVGLHLGILATVDFADLTVGMLMIHLITFDPAWIKPTFGALEVPLEFDGTCGLCHGFVRFVLAEDTQETFLFKPGDATLNKMRVFPVPQAPHHALEGAQAIVYVLGRLGGLWRLLGAGLSLLPDRLVEWGYTQVARRRHALFPPPQGTCPVPPARLKERWRAQ